jgi:aspartate dehydrogenase
MTPSPSLLKVGIAGVGAIGQLLAAALDRGDVRASLVGITDTNQALATEVAGRLKNAVPILALDELVRRSDLVVEAARQEALGEIVPATFMCRRERSPALTVSKRRAAAAWTWSR